MQIDRINIIGSGNVAWHLARKLAESCKISTVYSWNNVNAIKLADAIGSNAIDCINDVDKNADLTIVAVKDDVISEVADQLPKNLHIVHTSGSVGVEVFEQFENFGVLYPLQTFSKEREVFFDEIPILVESNSLSFTQDLLTFCQNNLSEKVINMSSKDRAKLHLSAVFACNFSTYLLKIAKDICDQNSLDFELLRPLVYETISKNFDLGPQNALTGPAKRKDKQLINKQTESLNNLDDKKIYELFSSLIMKLND